MSVVRNGAAVLRAKHRNGTRNARGGNPARDALLWDLIDRLYGAATDPERWPDFLGALTRSTASEAIPAVATKPVTLILNLVRISLTLHQ